MFEKTYSVYVMSDNDRRTLYIGITSDLEGRVYEHRHPAQRSFTAAYHCIHLVYYEDYGDVHQAIAREKQLKGWRRSKKIALVMTQNPRWLDLADDFDRQQLT